MAIVMVCRTGRFVFKHIFYLVKNKYSVVLLLAPDHQFSALLPHVCHFDLITHDDDKIANDGESLKPTHELH